MFAPKTPCLDGCAGILQDYYDYLRRLSLEAEVGATAMTILDVGSGLSQKGDVNVDIRRSVKPDVVASVNCLPFRDGVFDKVFCYHVLEHYGVHPVQALRELLRVSNDLVEVEVPHWLSGHRSNKPSPDTGEWWRHSNVDVMHRTFWVFWKPILIRTNFTYFKPFFLFSRPLSLTVTLRKEVTFA